MFFFSALLFIVLSRLSICEDGPTIEIPQGKLVGMYQKSYKGRTYSAFEGIPYAKPPVGELRFEEPQPLENWEGILYANTTYQCSYFLPLPMMWGAHGTEDCLYLYVYIPKEKIDEKENLDVIVHIHGGAFMLGSPKMLAKPDYIMDKDVIYVSFNYRLGILGFLSTEDDVVPGNNGLKDQVAALDWIKSNIKYFGGNPGSVTITGLSAGGVSVHYHYLSPMSKGLFQRGFSQSGTSLQNWALTKEPLQYTINVAEKLKCDISSTKQMVDCMKTVSVKELVESISIVFVLGDIIPFIPFGVVIERNSSHSFLAEHPYKILEKGQVYDVPWITSNVRDEGIIPVGFFNIFNLLKDIDERWYEIMPYALDIKYTVENSKQQEVLKQLREKYIRSDAITKENIYELVKLFTDRMFTCDAIEAVKMHAKVVKSPVRYYWFNYTLEQRALIPFMKKGVAHSDDGRLIFPTMLSPDRLDKEDEAMMEILTNFLTDYAADKDLKINNVNWRPVNPQSEDLDYIKINDPKDITLESISEMCDANFWESLPIIENNKLS